MIEILEYILYVVLAAFASRTIAHMLIYAYSYGQFLGWLKILVAKKIDLELTELTLKRVHSVSIGQDLMPDLYDKLCNYKGSWSWILSIMDCVFCTGFWVSVLVAIFVFSVFGLNLVLLLAIPVLTFFFIEKI